MKLVFLIGLLSSITSIGFCQESPYSCFIVVNTNLYFPGQGSNKGMYPSLGFDKTAEPKLLIGGFGVGISGFRYLKRSVRVKGQANFSKHAYWDEPYELRSANNEPLGHVIGGSADYAFGVTTAIHYSISEKVSIGTGLGAQVMLFTLSRIPEIVDFEFVPGAFSMHRYSKLVLPFVPFELSWTGNKLLWNIRYEYGLSNRFKRELAQYKTDRFSSLYFEVGWRIR